MKSIRILLAGDALSIPEFLLFMLVFIVIMSIVISLILAGADKSKEVAKNIKVKFEQKKQENELNKSIQSNMKEYQESKNSFQYFSDDRLLNIYNQFENGTKKSNMEQLALEEELVKRNLIDHSPMHEKLYAINKELFK
jgi:uncharacterized membrane protein YraQ (UPF0718 family)